MKTFVEVQFGNHLFTIYFIEIQFALVRKDVGVFMPVLTNEKFKGSFWQPDFTLKIKCMKFLANEAPSVVA